MDLPLWNYQFRIIMLGDSTVGKSSMLKRYTENQFLECINETVGVDFYVHFMEVEPGIMIKLQFWDTAGQERFRSVTRSYYRNSVGGMLVFDVGNRASFEHVRDWYAEVCEHVMHNSMIFALVGHKNDREVEGQRTVSRDEAEKLASQLRIPYLEASSKTGQNIPECFEVLTRRVYLALQTGEVKLRDGWDGIKSFCSLQEQQLKRFQGIKEQKEKNGCC